MKKRDYYFFRNSVLFLFSAILLAACTKDDAQTGSENKTISFNINNDQLRPLQVASVYMGEEDFTLSEYTGMLGDFEVSFKSINSKTLSFLVPEEISPGTVKLQLDVNGTQYSSEVKILENINFSDPQLVFENFYQQYYTNEFLNIDRQSWEEVKAQFESLNEEEKRKAAQMLLNNRQLLDNLEIELKNFYSGYRNSNPESSQTKMAESNKLAIAGLTVALVGALITSPVVAAVGAGITVGLALEVVIKSFKIITDAAMPKVYQALEVTYGLGYNRMAYTTELVYDAAERRILNKEQELPSQIVLREKEKLNLSVQLVTTPLVSEENRGEYDIVDELLDSISKLQEMLSGYFEIPGPPMEEFARFAENLQNFSVSVDNPDVEVSELSGTPEDASVFFETEKLEDQEFTFTYSYENEEGEISSISQGIKLDVGYNVVFLSGNGLPSPLEWTNNTPKAFKIVDYKDDDLENFEVSKLSIQNISNQEVKFHIQKNGVFNGDDPGEYFEIVPLTDLEEIEVDFELYYGDTFIKKFTVLISKGETTFFAFSYYEKSVKEFDGVTGEQVRDLEVAPQVLSFSDADQIVFSRSTNELIIIPSGDVFYKKNIESGESTFVTIPSEFNYDRHDLQMVVSREGRLFVYESGGRFLKLNIQNGYITETIGLFNGWLRNIVYSEKTKEIIGHYSEGDDDKLYKINVDTRQETILDLPDRPYEDLIISKSGRLFALQGYDTFIELDPETGNIISTISNRGFYYGTYLEGTNELIGVDVNNFLKVNVEDGEVTEISGTGMSKYQNFID